MQAKLDVPSPATRGTREFSEQESVSHISQKYTGSAEGTSCLDFSRPQCTWVCIAPWCIRHHSRSKAVCRIFHCSTPAALKTVLASITLTLSSPGLRRQVLKQAQLSLENAQKDRAKTTEASTFEIEVFPVDNGCRDNREKHENRWIFMHRK